MEVVGNRDAEYDSFLEDIQKGGAGECRLVFVVVAVVFRFTNIRKLIGVEGKGKKITILVAIVVVIYLLLLSEWISIIKLESLSFSPFTHEVNLSCSKATKTIIL